VLQVARFSVVHGMYAAGFLGTVLRGGAAAGLPLSNYFEPVTLSYSLSSR